MGIVLRQCDTDTRASAATMAKLMSSLGSSQLLNSERLFIWGLDSKYFCHNHADNGYSERNKKEIYAALEKAKKQFHELQTGIVFLLLLKCLIFSGR